MSNTINPNSGPAHVDGEQVNSSLPDSGPVDQTLINTLKLKLALLKNTPGMSQQVIATLQQQLDKLEAGSVTAAEATKTFDEAMAKAIKDTEDSAMYSIANFGANTLMEASQNKTLDELKKDGESDN